MKPALVLVKRPLVKQLGEKSVYLMVLDGEKLRCALASLCGHVPSAPCMVILSAKGFE